MSAPGGSERTVDTPEMTFSFDGAIVTIRGKGTKSTGPGVEAGYAAIREIAGPGPHRFLVDAREWPGGTPGAWVAIIRGIEGAISVGAMVVQPGGQSDFAAMLSHIDRLLLPVRIFETVEEAREFLEGSPGTSRR